MGWREGEKKAKEERVRRMKRKEGGMDGGREGGGRVGKGILSFHPYLSLHSSPNPLLHSLLPYTPSSFAPSPPPTHLSSLSFQEWSDRERRGGGGGGMNGGRNCGMEGGGERDRSKDGGRVEGVAEGERR